MEIVYFTVVAIALYFAADFILRWLETAWGGALKNRSIVFFFILLVLAVVTFGAIRFIAGS